MAVYVWFPAADLATFSRQRERTRVLQTMAFVGEKQPDLGRAELVGERAKRLVRHDDDCERQRGRRARGRTRRDGRLSLGDTPLSDELDEGRAGDLAVDCKGADCTFAEPLDWAGSARGRKRGKRTELVRPVSDERRGTDDDRLVDGALSRERRLLKERPEQRDALKLPRSAEVRLVENTPSCPVPSRRP